MTKVGQGTLVLTNSVNSINQFDLSVGTVAITQPACLGTNEIIFMGTKDGSSLQFRNSMTFPNEMQIPVIGNKAIWFDTQGNNVNLTGAFSEVTSSYNTVDLYKIGSGTLNFASSQPGTAPIGTLYVNQGMAEFSSSPASGNYHTPLGGSSTAGNIEVAPVMVPACQRADRYGIQRNNRARPSRVCRSVLGHDHHLRAGGHSTVHRHLNLRQRDHRSAVEL